MTVSIRPAVLEDQETIRSMVRAAHLNPLDLDWQHFLVAEDSGRIAGIGQVKSHRDGSRELASLVVLPDRRRQSIGGALIRALLEREPAAVYLMCRQSLQAYYARFGFEKIEPEEMPRFFRRFFRLAGVISKIVRRPSQLIVMKRPASLSLVDRSSDAN